jgi:hypothetical protein
MTKLPNWSTSAAVSARRELLRRLGGNRARSARVLVIASVFSAIPLFPAQSAEPIPSKPTLLPGEYPVSRFDLFRGSGRKMHGCMFVAFGPGIKPEDLDVKYVKENSVEIAIKGTNDALLCSGFYAPGRRSSAPLANFRFYDANRWTFEDIDKRANLRGRATPMPQSPPPTGPRSGDYAGRCVVDGVLYPDSACPKGAAKDRQKFAAAPERKLDAPRLPEVQSGRWNLTGEPEYCGDPLQNIRREIAASEEARKVGCAVTTSSAGSRRFSLVVDCPAPAVSADGSRTFTRGQASISVSSPNPQSLILDLQMKDGQHRRVTGTRVGDC